MKAAQERPGPPACTAWSAKSLSSIRAGAPRRPKDSTDIGTKGRAENICRYARSLEASLNRPLQTRRYAQRPQQRRQLPCG
jgi:hypothetical protein